MLLAPGAGGDERAVDVWVLWIAVALALAAMIDYAIGAVKKLKQAKKL